MKIFKTIISLSLLFLMNKIEAQIGIGIDSIDGKSILLDFKTGTTNGILLPITNYKPSNPSNGTFAMDYSDKKIKMFVNGSWINLSDAGNVDAVIPNTSNDIGTSIIMGSATSSATGVLVLESPNKAMVLPKVTNANLNVISPYPGMICYDITSETLAVFDGSVWNYWN